MDHVSHDVRLRVELLPLASSRVTPRIRMELHVSIGPVVRMRIELTLIKVDKVIQESGVVEVDEREVEKTPDIDSLWQAHHIILIRVFDLPKNSVK